jgi:hypothetical protein
MTIWVGDRKKQGSDARRVEKGLYIFKTKAYIDIKGLRPVNIFADICL